MIAAEQMEDAVHDQVAEVVDKPLALLVRLASHRLEGEHHVAEQKRRIGRNVCSRFPSAKCEHVSRSILPPISVIEPLLLGIVGQHNAEFDPRR